MDNFNRTDIFYSIVDNNYKKFLKELESLENINIVDVNEMSLLHFCGEYSRPQFANHLIEKGIDTELKDKYGNNALWKATFNYRGNYELVKLLIDNKSNSNSKNKAGKSPIELAFSFGDERLIGILSAPEDKHCADWKQLEKPFDYEISEHNECWTHTKSESERLDDYLENYSELKNIEAKYSLMEMIIQAVNDQSDDKFEMYWKRLVRIMDVDFELNKPTIYYWCDWMNENLTDSFRISEKMRGYWLNKIRKKVL